MKLSVEEFKAWKNKNITLIGGKLISPKNLDIAIRCELLRRLHVPDHLMFGETDAIQLSVVDGLD